MTEALPAPETNKRTTLSFKAVVVMTRNDGEEPTLKSVEVALRKAGYTFVMPSPESDAPILISVSDEQ